MSRIPEVYNQKLGFYPEKKILPQKPFDTFFHNTLSYVYHRYKNSPVSFQKIAEQVRRFGKIYDSFSSKRLQDEIAALRKIIHHEGLSDELIYRSFALIRENAGRTLDMFHFDSQITGGWILLQGMIAEMETGEGKTLTATLPACTAAFTGIPVHIITVNDYLAERDANQMQALYDAMGLSVGVIKHGLTPEKRRSEYSKDIVYCTNKEIVFDYLKDYLKLPKKPGYIAGQFQPLVEESGAADNLCLRGLGFAIVDEADSVMIDEARTPLIISGRGNDEYQKHIYTEALAFADLLQKNNDFTIDSSTKKIRLTDQGHNHLEDLTQDASGIWKARLRREELIRLALSALHLFQENIDYIITEGAVQIVDQYTGRVMADRSWEGGLHQLIESKEGCELSSQKETLARISYQRFFRRYHLLAGMTGTAIEVRKELWAVYNLQVIRVKTHKPLIRQKDTNQYFTSEDSKLAAVLHTVQKLHARKIPVLIGTTTVAVSEKISALLQRHKLMHTVLNAKQDKKENEIIASAGKEGQIMVATNMAGRGTDIRLGPGVCKIGGLFVLATERHSAQRIDRQLYGRCGRQGDPGKYAAFVSLDDEIIKPYTKLPFLYPFVSYCFKQNSFLSRAACNFMVGRAQRTLEKKYFKMRQQLLLADESLERILAFSGEGE